MNPEEMAEAQKSSYAEFIQTVNNLMKTVESVGNTTVLGAAHGGGQIY